MYYKGMRLGMQNYMFLWYIYLYIILRCGSNTGFLRILSSIKS
ncbi:hypothetical protein HMPREF0999_00656 [Parabacteroides sp. D25]|uniref:Uncharacterized protein n=1 Tax=Myoviridae sp. ct1IL4 TaxID=2825019 RepID=A0A8S5Q7F9_9CAUD|nr:hypothetical protein HMPREF0999_00656 [Parabacteroides sp. D25]KMW34403.1 hypothetical protein BSDG_04662 [Parabacteroides sp. 2_1_7]DAE14890.1 MAG TPA: hypothetical protein [Myoviridae sp. ct1IL4]